MHSNESSFPKMFFTLKNPFSIPNEIWLADTQKNYGIVHTPYFPCVEVFIYLCSPKLSGHLVAPTGSWCKRCGTCITIVADAGVASWTNEQQTVSHVVHVAKNRLSAHVNCCLAVVYVLLQRQNAPNAFAGVGHCLDQHPRRRRYLFDSKRLVARKP